MISLQRECYSSHLLEFNLIDHVWRDGTNNPLSNEGLSILRRHVYIAMLLDNALHRVVQQEGVGRSVEGKLFGDLNSASSEIGKIILALVFRLILQLYVGQTLT